MTAPFLPPFDVDAVLQTVTLEAAHAQLAARTWHDEDAANRMRDHLTAGALAKAYDLARDLCSSGQRVAVRRHAVSITVLLTRVSDYLQTATVQAPDPAPTDADSGPCPATIDGPHTWTMLEDGYSRAWRVDLDDKGHVTAADPDGFSDDGDGEPYLQCRQCLHRQAAILADGFQWG